MAVVIISDDERGVRMLRWALGEAGHNCADFPDAQSMIDATPAPADIILYDGPICAGKRDGARRLRHDFPETRMIGLHVHDDRREEHIEAEAHLHKPFDADDLLHTIDLVLARPIGSTSDHHH